MDFNSAMRYLINCMRSGGIEHHLTVLQILLDNRYTNSEWEEMFERFDMMYECDCSDLDFESRKSYYRAQAIQNCSQVPQGLLNIYEQWSDVMDKVEEQEKVKLMERGVSYRFKMQMKRNSEIEQLLDEERKIKDDIRSDNARFVLQLEEEWIRKSTERAKTKSMFKERMDRVEKRRAELTQQEDLKEDDWKEMKYF